MSVRIAMLFGAAKGLPICWEFAPVVSNVCVAFLLFPQATELDLTGPAQILSRLGKVKIELVAKSLDPVPTDAGFSIVPTATMEAVQKADVLCIPGGLGMGPLMEDADTLEWISAIAEHASWITSFCTGSLLLGAAGLLRGRKATSHWTALDQLKWFGAIPVKDRVVFDGNDVTGAGITAGIDFALALAAKIRGDDHAKLIQLSLEYDPAPPFDGGDPETTEPAILERFNAVAGASLAEQAKRPELMAKRMAKSG